MTDAQKAMLEIAFFDERQARANGFNNFLASDEVVEDLTIRQDAGVTELGHRTEYLKWCTRLAGPDRECNT